MSLIILLLILLVAFVLLFNSIVRKKNQVDNAFGSIDVMLKKRYDLIPGLIEIVKGYMKHETTLLNELTEMRTKYLHDDISSDEKVKLENQIRSKLNVINVSVENYPDLKSGENFIHLQKVWNETEEQISASRRFYNSAVTEYNTKIQQFPALLVAKVAGYKQKNVFTIPNEQRENNMLNFY